MKKKQINKGTHPVDLYAGQRLRYLRSVRGLSQTALGQRLETPITFQQIQKYELGANRIATSRLYEFSKVLEVPIAYFLEGFEDEAFGIAPVPANPIQVVPEHARETGKLIKNYYALPSLLRKRIYDFIAVMAKENLRNSGEEGQ